MRTYLDNFLSRELVAEMYKTRHGGTANSAKLREITTHVDQGLEFFESARHADISIKPLLQFYGIASLSRAVCLFLKPGLTQSALTAGHGLKINYGTGRSSLHDNGGLQTLELTVCRGLFTDLSKATLQLDLLKANSNKANFRVEYNVPKIDTSFTFEALLSLFPDMWDSFAKWSKWPQSRYILKGITNSKDDETEWIIYPSIDDEQATLLFGAKPITNEYLQSENQSKLVLPPQINFQFAQKNDDMFGIGSLYVVTPIGPNIQLSTISTMYAVAYTLSMLARYRLTDWLQVWSGGKGDAARPLFQAFIDMIDEEFPRICAEQMLRYAP